MKIYRLKCETLIKRDGVKIWENKDLIKTDMDVISKYLVDANKNPEKYRNLEFYIGNLEKCEDIDIETIEKIFL